VDALVKTSFDVMRVVTQVAAGLGISSTQVRVFGILRDNEPRLSELAEYLGLDKSSISGLIDRAEQRALVERRIDDADRRATRVRLTAAGRELARTAERDIVEGIAPLIAHLDDAGQRAIVDAFRAHYPERP
jgi:DNA-binding MarR family transcriptional regulator